MLGEASDMMPITLPAPSSVERNRPISSDAVRKRALQRLYRRRAAVEDLIRSLETYQRSTRLSSHPAALNALNSALRGRSR